MNLSKMLIRSMHRAASAGATMYKCLRRFSTIPPPPMIKQRRVVVTGMGAVTPFGVGKNVLWDAIIAGKTATKAIEQQHLTTFPAKVAAAVPRGSGPQMFAVEDFVDKANMRTQGVDFIAFAMAAAKEALLDAKLSTVGDGSYYDSGRFGVAIGSGIGNIEEIGTTANLLNGNVETGQRKVSPFFVPRILNNMAAGNISIKYALQGPNHAVSTACATGAHAIGDAFRFIKYGDADAMLAGGSEASINALSLAGFSRAKALATAFNDAPARASRPFDTSRDGFVIGEGAAVLVLEEMESALARGAEIYAEIRGYGTSGDAHHITAPKDDGSGAFRCMLAALREGGLDKGDVGVDYINAHATSTPLGDNIEGRAIERLLKTLQQTNTSNSNKARTLVSSSKGAIGHLLGAAGCVEAVITILSIKQKTVPPTANLENLDPSLPVNLCDFPTQAVSRDVKVALKNSFGFGGTNCSLLFTEFLLSALMRPYSEQIMAGVESVVIEWQVGDGKPGGGRISFDNSGF